ncbi:MAG: hypothetical protein U0525_00340 [Patescibacteria group bacterium]
MSTVYQKVALCILVLSVATLSFWSWVLMDPNFTLISHADWTLFREFMINIGYKNRGLSWNIYLPSIILLSLSSLYLSIRPVKKPFVWVVLVGIIAAIFSYPALSHDLFNYIFDAKILTVYGQNPYLHKALDFPADPMIRFMRWIHRAYPYGPSYLLLSLIPSYLGFGIFSLTYFMFKGMHLVLYLFAAKRLEKISKTAVMLFAFSPLVIVEGLINTHNDFIALTLGVIAVTYIFENKNKLLTRVLLWSSMLTKFTALPVVILSERWFFTILSKKIKLVRVLIDVGSLEKTSFLALLTIIVYQSLKMEVQSWYFLNLLIFIPYFPRLFKWMSPFIFSLILSYYPYIIGGEWGQGGDVNVKKMIINVGAFVNVVLIFAFLYIPQIIVESKKMFHTERPSVKPV